MERTIIIVRREKTGSIYTEVIKKPLEELVTASLALPENGRELRGTLLHSKWPSEQDYRAGIIQQFFELVVDAVYYLDGEKGFLFVG